MAREPRAARELTATRYARCRMLLQEVTWRLEDAEEAHRRHGPTSAQEEESAERLSRAALELAIAGREVECRGADKLLADGSLLARVLVALHAAESATGAIHTPMDATLAHVCSAAELLSQALEKW